MDQTRADAAKRIAELADDPRFATRRDDLNSLGAALADESISSWTGIDLLAAFPPQGTISIGQKQWGERVLGVLAGVSVFVPVAWTWFSLHSATGAYRELLAAGDEEGRTFLGMWVQGFDGRLDEPFWGLHRLVPMAMTSFILILIAVGFIVAHRVAAELNVHREEASAGDAHTELVSALVTAQRHLNQRRSDDPRFLEAAVERSVSELNKAHEETRKGIAALQQATQVGVDRINEASQQLTGSMAPLLASATAAGSELAASAASATKAEQQISASVESVKVQLSTALDQFERSVTGNTSQLSEKTTAAVAELTDKVAQVASVNGQLAQEVADATKANNAATAHAAEVNKAATHALADASKASITHLADANKASLAELAGGTASSLNELTAAVQQLAKLLEAHGGAVVGQKSELSRATDLAGQILAELRDQAPLSEPVSG